jgi:hypothetical protein
MSDTNRHRVWNTKRNCFLTDKNTLIDNNGDLYMMKGGLIPLDPEIYIVDRCTGLKDYKEDLLYKGDILFCDLDELYGEVKYGEFYCQESDELTLGFFVDWGEFQCSMVYDEDGVIAGNIHENHELLESK